MTEEAQRVAIAEALGWKRYDHTQGKHAVAWTAISPDGAYSFWGSIPDYLHDLNAMHDAEKVLKPSDQRGASETWDAYIKHLLHIGQSAGTHGFHSTAPQRAEAFLRTLNLWIE